MSGVQEKIGTSFELQLAVWKHPIPAIALAHHISIPVLEVRIRREEIIKPPHAYWEKIKSGLSHDKALVEIGWTRPMIKKINAILASAKASSKSASQF